jgi:hypothetical protein
MKINGRLEQFRSLSNQRMSFNDVNFDPSTSNTNSHGNLMELLKRPDRPYEQCRSPRKGSISASNHTEETTLTIEEESDGDDSFGYSFGSNTMKNVMNQYAMDDVVEEEEEATVLSGCESYAAQRYEYQPRRHVRQDPLRHSMPAKTTSSSFRNKLKPVSFHIRAKRQTAPLNGGHESQDTEGTIMSTDDEFDKTPLFVDRAADSLMLHQKQQYQEEGPRKRGKSKSRLSRFLNR